MSDVLRTIDLGKRFGRTVVLDGMNMAVPEGAIYGLVGPNGVGKSTTIKILMNILQPSAGGAEVFGHDSRRISASGDLTRIGYVSENQELPEWMTVEYFMAYLKPFYPAWDDVRAEELLRQFELPRDRKLRHLSHGMRMKAALASALAYRPRLIVLDEPFTGLDALVRDELIAGLLESADGATARVSEWPASWLRVEQSSTLVRFVDAQFDKERTMADVRRLFGEGRQIDVRPMPLREIFVTLARAGRKAA